MQQKTIAYIGLGSNLSDPKVQVSNAAKEIADITNCRVIALSSLYLSKPMGPQDQDDYINAVVSLETSLSALDLLNALQKIENSAGRVRKDNRWGARILDCDILLYGNKNIDNERLTVPHYGMTVREFVLLPLAEIAPNLSLPDGTSISSLASEINCNGIVKL
ncbi:2-amino-4-hydroxy-6-hydroxymethyldihydropteridine diphosphokinase [Colwellia psychrerythraea]|uniref:2-amino-4-hydroxy-6-hydroxymethyldihydropteridine pyrophosphokinase n=1 Tax=Colwellia psychrerythraea TaxID=28229 RepID=A0A099KM56_COLPS|nr:2-amino-4-hydroxy-6-hydroxymethyldihydropteridine diphosphokinase [Colwellia psychrerythraea]KGJ90698.1 2-amino-4-hydroxy-6-hydroxymethyldihydropteridine pyrophosphokinase [Colwellia psychrerythraea]